MEIREEQYLLDELPAGVLAVSLPDEFSARLVDRLKREADQSWYSNPQRSLQFAARIVDIGRHRDDPNQIALGLLAEGNALKFAVRPTEAWDALQRSGRMFQFAGNDVGWARTRISLLGIALVLGRMTDVLADAQRARAILREHQQDEMIVRLDITEGLVLAYLGDYQPALKLFYDGLAIAATLGDQGYSYKAPLFLNIGFTYEKLGDYHQALAYFEPAHDLMLARHETLGSDTARLNVASIARIQGRFRYALKNVQEVLERTQPQALVERLSAQEILVECYLQLNRYDEARELGYAVAAAYRARQDLYRVARTLLLVALAEAAGEDFAAAQAALAESEQIFRALGAGAWVANTWLERGQIALQRGDLPAALDCASHAAVEFESRGQQEKFVASTLLRAHVLLAQGQAQAAAREARKTLRNTREDAVPSLRYQAHLLLGKAAEAQNDWRRATRRYQAAAATMDRVQRGLTITLRAGFLEDKDEALRALIALCLRSERPREAFEALERAKSQILLGYLTNRDLLRWSPDDARNRALIEQLNLVRAEHQHYYGLAHRLPGGAERDALAPNAALAETKTRERRMRTIIEQLYLQSGEGLEAHRTPNASFAEIQRAVDADSLLIEYYVDSSSVWAFCLDGGTLTTRSLPIGAAVVTQLLSQLRMNVTAALGHAAGSLLARNLLEAARRILRRLFAGLIEPLALEQYGRRRLVVVPYGPLHYLPFHLLFDGVSYLIEKYEVVILPAANMVMRRPPQREPGALILTHSWDGRLPQTLPEGRMVQAVMGGTLFAEDASRRAILQTAPAQVLHIAAHGEHRLDQPDLSYLQLADGQLFADDLLQQDLSYELVTLSACETGRAKAAARDELIGLGRGFLYAGAGSLLVSLWQVEDTSTYRLMEGVYRALHAGVPKGAALRKAQREMLSEQPTLHPAHWGAFQLIGDAGPLSKQRE